MKTGRKPEGRQTVSLATRLTPWTAFLLRKYAETYNMPINFTVGLAVNGLTHGVPKKLMEKWLREFRKSKEAQNDDC